MVVRATVKVTDLNSQSQESESTLVLHPCEYYVGFQFMKYFGVKNEPIETKVIVTDVDGNLIANVPIECVIMGYQQKKSTNENGEAITEYTEDEQHFNILSSNTGGVTMTFTPKIGNIQY